MMTYEDCSALTDYDYETNNYNVGDGTGKWDYPLPMEHADKEYGNAGMAVLNPMSFIMTNFYIEPKPYDWFCINPDDQACLWGSVPGRLYSASCFGVDSRRDFRGRQFRNHGFRAFLSVYGVQDYLFGNHDGSDEFGRYWTRSMYSEEGAEGRSIYMQASASGMELPFEGRAMSMAVRCVKIQ